MTNMHAKGPHFVYAIECEGYIKVGKTNNVAKRVKLFGAGCPFPIRVLRVYEFSARGFASRTELAVQSELYKAGLHHRGEWFKGGQTLILDIVESVIVREGSRGLPVEGCEAMSEVEPRLSNTLKALQRKVIKEVPHADD